MFRCLWLVFPQHEVDKKRTYPAFTGTVAWQLRRQYGSCGESEGKRKVLAMSNQPLIKNIVDSVKTRECNGTFYEVMLDEH